ncbi:MAG: glycosyltransferase family 39 protein [Acidobacteriota bacterium]
MSASSTSDLSTPAAPSVRTASRTDPARVELWFRRGLLVVSAMVAVVLLASAGLMLWAQNEFAPPESVVSAHSQMLARDGTLYYSLKDYPYTVSAYMPIFYGLEATTIRLGIPAPTGGRLITFTALLSLIAMCWQVVLLYTKDRLAAWIAAILLAASPLMIYWGVVAQVDILAVSLAMTAFYFYSRDHVQATPHTLWLAGLFAGLALFTKQTMVAIPTAIFLLLCLRRDWKRAAGFALGFGGGMIVLVLAINAALDGRFLANTVFANLNPMSLAKFATQAQYLVGVCAGLLVVVAATLGFCFQKRTQAPLVYLACATLVFLATAPKIGSDTNYQLELAATLAVVAGVGLHQAEFFQKFFRGSQHWVTLLLLPLGVHVWIGARVGVNMLLTRVATEQMFRSEIDGLRQYVPASGAKVLSTDFNASARLHGRMDVEPLIYGLLVKAGRVDPEPVRRDLEHAAFSTVILDHDVFKPNASDDLELTALPPAQLDEIRRHYQLVAHVAGPYMDGAFVYKPKDSE